jgi:hypothetical protein
LLDGDSLVTGCGGRLQVIYPGWENRDSGPDFRDAVIAASDGLLIGDVEIHLRSGDWRCHGHNRDPKYNGVILQAVWEGEAPAELQNGKTAPTLCLRHRLKAPLEEVRQLAFLDLVPAEPCRGAGQRLSPGELGRLLDEAGEERFRRKAERFTVQMNEESPSQVLYRGIMGALGYTRNRERFEELARRLPWAVLEGFCRGKSPAEQVEVLRSLLMGMAGLLPAGSRGNFEPVDDSGWEFFRVRPDNQPQRRLIGAARLFAHFMGEGLVERAMRLVRESGPDTERLEAGIAVGAAGHYPEEERALIGQGRAREVAVNIILPFAFARAEASSQPALAEQALELYIRCPKLGENEITRRMTALLFGGNGSKLIDSARRQQGLIHLEKSYCVQRWCRVCPIGQRIAVPEEIPSSKSQRKPSVISGQQSRLRC